MNPQDLQHAHPATGEPHHHHDHHKEKCPTCHGMGHREAHDKQGHTTARLVCPACGGRGWNYLAQAAEEDLAHAHEVPRPVRRQGPSVAVALGLAALATFSSFLTLGMEANPVVLASILVGGAIVFYAILRIPPIADFIEALVQSVNWAFLVIFAVAVAGGIFYFLRG